MVKAGHLSVALWDACLDLLCDPKKVTGKCQKALQNVGIIQAIAAVMSLLFGNRLSLFSCDCALFGSAAGKGSPKDCTPRAH